MASPADARRRARVFNAVATDYDRHRPGYPDEVVDRACADAGLAAGAAVLEIGCGTGQLTRSLLARGLRVTAVEPGAELLARARTNLQDMGEVLFLNARLEDAELPHAHYAAAFSASAIHWVDPEVGWRRLGDALVDGGGLALLSYFGLDDPRSADDQQALRDALAAVAPESAAEWPTYRDLDSIREGAAARRDNIAELWAWLGDYAVGHADAAALFEPAELVTLPALLEHSAAQLNALIGTMSFWSRLTPSQREALAVENRAVEQRLGRAIRSSTVACLATARRRQRR